MEKQFMVKKSNRYTRQKKRVIIVRLTLLFFILILINLPMMSMDIEKKYPWKTLNAPSLAVLELIDTNGTIEKSLDGIGYIMAVSIPNALFYLLILILLNKLVITRIKEFFHYE